VRIHGNAVNDAGGSTSITNSRWTNCSITNNTFNGNLNIIRNTETSGSDTNLMTDCIISDNVFKSDLNIDWNLARNNATVLTRCIISDNIFVDTGSDLLIEATDNTSTTQVLVDNSVITGNVVGGDISLISGGSTSSITVKESIISDNNFATSVSSLTITNDNSNTSASKVAIVGNIGTEDGGGANIIITEDCDNVTVVGNIVADLVFTDCFFDNGIVAFNNLVVGSLDLSNGVSTTGVIHDSMVIGNHIAGSLNITSPSGASGNTIKECMFANNFVASTTTLTSADTDVLAVTDRSVFVGNLFGGTVTISNTDTSASSDGYVIGRTAFIGNEYKSSVIFQNSTPDHITLGDSTIIGNIISGDLIINSDITDLGVPSHINKSSITGNHILGNIAVTKSAGASENILDSIISSNYMRDLRITNSATSGGGPHDCISGTAICNNKISGLVDLSSGQRGMRVLVASEFSGNNITGTFTCDNTQINTGTTGNQNLVTSSAINGNIFGGDVSFTHNANSEILFDSVFSNNVMPGASNFLTIQHGATTTGGDAVLFGTTISGNKFGAVTIGRNAASMNHKFEKSSYIGNTHRDPLTFASRSINDYEHFLVLGNVSTDSIDFDHLGSLILPPTSNDSEIMVAFNRFDTWTGVTATTDAPLVWHQNASGGGDIEATISITTTAGQTVNWTGT